MFEHVVLRRTQSGDAITAGQIAEALLFYQKVHLILDRNTLFHLVRQIGARGVVSLVGRPDVSAVYTEETLGTITNSIGVTKYHDFCSFSFKGSETAGQLPTIADRLSHDLTSTGLQTKEAAKIAKIILARVPNRKLSGNHFINGGVTNLARTDLTDIDFLQKASRKVLANLPGGKDPGDNIKIETIQTELGFVIFDNIDFSTINARRAAMRPPLEEITIAHVLTAIYEARADLVLASHYGGDFVTSSTVSAVLQIKFAELLVRSKRNSDDRQQFAQIVLSDMPTIAEAIDSGERTFHDFLKLLDKSDRFKNWLRSANPDEGLTREYLKSTTSQDWIQTTKAKSVRYLLSLAVDATNPVLGLAAGIADNFILEKLLKGWRPSHFIDGRLTPFLRGH